MITVLFIIAYYCGSAFDPAEVAAIPYAVYVNRPLGDAVAVSLE